MTHFALWRGLVVWNDVRRYSDLPLDSKEKPLYPPNQRNITNEFQIRYLSSAHEAYLVLALWNLLYDESKDTKGHLRKLAERLLDCGVKSKCFRMEHLNDCLSFLENKQSAKAFERYRHKRLAHLGTYEETTSLGAWLVHEGMRISQPPESNQTVHNRSWDIPLNSRFLFEVNS